MSNKVKGRTWLVDNSSPDLVALGSIGFIYNDITASRLTCNSIVYVENVTDWKLPPTHVKKVIDGIKVLKNLIIDRRKI